MRKCQAIITVATGKRGTQQFPVQRVQAYTTQQSMDNDADAFSVDIGDPNNALNLCLDRDNEVRVQLFLDDAKGNFVPIFNGIADAPQRGEDKTLSIQGRDTPSALAVDSDAMPGRWKHVQPEYWIAGRAHALGISQTAIANMSSIKSLYTDGSEKEWALWYRVARKKGMYMWADNIGGLIIDKLGYALAPTYYFGRPSSGSSAGWMAIQAINEISSKQGRVRRVLVYGETAKKNGKAIIAQGVDTTIGSWKRKPLMILTSTTDRTQTELQKTANEEVFESIVGAQEIEIVVQDTGALIMQNRMAQINVPELDIHNEVWFVVGVQREGGFDGMTQRVRLREKGFALSKRVPNAPTLAKPDLAENKPAGSIAGALSEMTGIRWADSFVRATNEFGVKAGWDFAVFLGVLLSIASHEHGDGAPNNVRGSVPGAINGVAWVPFDKFESSEAPNRPGGTREQYERTFANAQHNPYNPRYPLSEDAVGPMQLVTPIYKQWADQYGWNGVAKSGEYDGGRWNPDSNIRAGARALVEKLKAAHANPLDANTIWVGVARYYGSKDEAANQRYADAVKKLYKDLYEAEASGAVAVTNTLPPGSTATAVAIPGHGTLRLPDATPDVARKAINFCLRLFGDPYVWGGYGPHYDCSSFVTKALASAAPYLRRKLDEPNQEQKYHGETTYTLWGKGDKVAKDNLLPGDLVFFRGNPPEHVGMYLFDGLFIHDPAPGKLVRVNSIGEDYYRERYSGARRYITWITRPG